MESWLEDNLTEIIIMRWLFKANLAQGKGLTLSEKYEWWKNGSNLFIVFLVSSDKNFLLIPSIAVIGKHI